MISGEDFDSATAVIDRRAARDVGVDRARSSWTATAPNGFADATTEAVGGPGAHGPDRDHRRPRGDLAPDGADAPITGGTGVITGGFSEQEAKDLATQLNAGALPVELTRQSVRTVSPTLGEESLQQGIVAGLGGPGRCCSCTCSSTTGCSASWRGSA